jgi:hypothetical protein
LALINVSGTQALLKGRAEGKLELINGNVNQATLNPDAGWQCSCCRLQRLQAPVAVFLV